jgi:hypothetical protein
VARGGDHAILDSVIAPGLGPAASSSRAAVLLVRASRFSIRLTGKPAGGHLVPMLCHRVGFLRLTSGIALRWLLSSLTRMHHDKAQGFLSNTAIAVFDLRLSEHALAMPAPGALSLGPPGLLDHQGQRGLLLSPGFQFLPDGTGARDQGHSAHTAFEAPPPCPATIRLTLRHDPAHPCQAQSPALRNGEWRFHTVTPGAIPPTNTQGQPASATHPETQEHLLAIASAGLAVPISRPGRSGSLRLALRRPLERHGRGVLRQPGCRAGVDLECLERQRTPHLSESGRTQRIEDVPQPVIMKREPRESRLQQC